MVSDGLIKENIMAKIYGIIYKATNKINGKIYIGQTTRSFDRRIAEHRYYALSGKGNATYFHSAIRKHGQENFVWEIIAECNSLEELNKAEVEMVKKYDTFGNGYNLDSGGKIRTEFRHTEEAKEKISKGNMGQKRTMETRNKMSKAHKGKVKSKVHCKNISIAKKGKKRSNEAIEKMIAIISKNYKIITPNGDVIFVKGLKQFCREYKDEKLCDSSLIKVAKGKIRHYKGYKCEYMEDKINVL